MTPLQFVDKWRPVTLTERAAAQEHFIDLCRLFDHPTPVEDDPTGERFTFEKGVKKSGGGDGFADVWYRGHFAWEYKKKKRSLDDALGQLARYALALESPPLHIVCDTDRFRIVTAYTNSVPKSYDLSLEEILDPEKRGWLNAAFYAPKKLQPGEQRSDLTKAAADRFSSLAESLQGRFKDAARVGHFINQIVFLFFAEDVGIIKDNYFRRVLRTVSRSPALSKDLLGDIFGVLHKGGRYGLDNLPWINGGLFDGGEAFSLNEHEVALLVAAGSQHWAHIDPTIFGTLFERFLDPEKRSQIGAHYTDIDKIMKIIEPTIIRPLRTEWASTKTKIEICVTKAKSKKTGAEKHWKEAEEHRSRFLERLRKLTILDPACGSGNFLYIALREVKGLEHAANQECEVLGLPPRWPMVGPEILHGIEINRVAAELARTTIWIGDIQWGVQNGFSGRPEPILRKLDSIERRDAIVENGVQAQWPPAEFIIGNPPFLGSSKFLKKLGVEETKQIRTAFSGEIVGAVDLYVYWFAKALRQIELGLSRTAGLVSKNTFQQASNCGVLKRISETVCLFEVHTRLPWVNDGAAVEVHLICFSKEKYPCILNGDSVSAISFNLREQKSDVVHQQPLQLTSNAGVCFNGIKRNGPFDIDGTTARAMLQEAINPNGRPNSDVIFPYINGDDLLGRGRDRWLIDFGWSMTEKQAALYEKPYDFVARHVKPKRAGARTSSLQNRWWEFEGLRKSLRRQLAQLKFYFAMSEKSYNYIWEKIDARIVPDNRLIVVASEDLAVFGVLQSSFHERWMELYGSLLEDRRCYTPTTTFMTFPFPFSIHNSSDSRQGDNQHAAEVREAARELLELRSRWLNPSDLVTVLPEVLPGIPLRTLPTSNDAATRLKKRTLANLYKERPEWLQSAHRRLDAAVALAYDWDEDVSATDAIQNLNAMNHGQWRQIDC